MTATLTEQDLGATPPSGESVSTVFTPPSRPPAARIVVRDEPPRWLPYVIQRLNEMAAQTGVPDDGLLVPNASVLGWALSVLGSLLSDASPSPSVVPTVEGGVQFAWHKAGWDAELEVRAEANIIWVRGPGEPHGQEGSLGDMRVLFVHAMGEMERS